MAYETLDALTLALMTRCDTLQANLGLDLKDEMDRRVMAEAVKADDECDHLKHLLLVYFEAFAKPPEGVIGVGAITYAEDALAAAQGGDA